MERTIKVYRDGKVQNLETEFLKNNDVVIKKRIKGEDFEITLHRFQKEEIEELINLVASFYENRKIQKAKSHSFKEKLENFFK